MKAEHPLANLALSFGRMTALLLAVLALVLVACGGDSDSDADDDDETPAADATREEPTEESEEPNTPRSRRSATSEATEEPEESDDEAAAAEWTREVCAAAVAYRDQAESSGEAIRDAAGSATAIKSEVLAEYDLLLEKLVAYRDSVNEPPAPDFEGGEQAQATWGAWVADSVEQLETVISNVEGLPDGSEFGPSYQQFVADADDDFTDQSFTEDMESLADSFPAVGTVLETLNSDPACN